MRIKIFNNNIYNNASLRVTCQGVTLSLVNIYHRLQWWPITILNTVATGVPQGSVLGPLLFLLYTADIPLFAGQFGLGVHCYADDGQLYIFDRAGHSDRLVSKVTVCINEIDEWMSSDRLILNTDKT